MNTANSLRWVSLPFNPTYFSEIAAQTSKSELLFKVASTATSHPTDTHPPINLRLQALGLSVAELRDSALVIDTATSSVNLLSNATQIEEELTEIEHRVLLERGMARLPEDEQQQ